MNVIQIILSAIGGTTVIVVFVVFLVKVFIKQMLRKDIEKLRASLRMDVLEHEVVFSRLHNRRIEVIADIYAALKHLYRRAIEYADIIEFSGEPSREEKRRALARAAEEYFDKFDKQKIWLDESLARAVEEFFMQLIKPVRDLASFSDIAKEDAHFSEEMLKKWIEANQIYKKQIPQAIVLLENEFRRTLTQGRLFSR